ncbi:MULTISPECIES: uridine diphosphate-N-acetylglucosamine-binding protein YvcK [Isoptericola]|uniref:Putative gluconeogenesis factor n=1 Tax=Isoptericola sediminis TaxID=2733572 RepID=A0A849K1Q0_9MICO|nr:MULTISPECIES: uridine diphosphate-N-acetylglucosamine-binding protein YvcK [unclassified Isoptericola]MDO8148585.1 uridine diphosphate-N-acetylglucosamine-binding protein YvcK [Isoptericola sp. b515]MDO8151469.1 uridine diphosphate-N-acetylglucosamine-binding protein YvcK [Isoptericola sp. b408]NNU26190.1 uridine diphosphate-N-acetylglucosamine-binding protein YvcK [Isoptericola sediminis]
MTPDREESSGGPAVTALGGGHGLSASLGALRLLTERLTAVVTVADDGGSSGRLRQELGVVPPGDLRMALAALCDDSEWGRTWSGLLQHRFASDGELDGHAMGNLLIAALWQRLGNTVEGLDWVGRLLGARGRVLPMSSVPLVVEADVSDGDVCSTVVGQSRVAVTDALVEQLRLVPSDPPACPEAVRAVLDADWVVMGPGSWYSSVLVHLLVPELAAALHRTTARRCVTLNLSAERGETHGLSASQHLEALSKHAPGLRVDAVLADPSQVDDRGDLERTAADLGARLVIRQVGRGDGTSRHDPLRLAAAYHDVFEGVAG